MSNQYPPNMGDRKIPTEEDERGVKVCFGHLLSNDAFHCRPHHLWPKGIADAKAEWMGPMELYLANFCKPIQSMAKEIKCVSCDLTVTGHNVILVNPRTKQNITYSPHGLKEGRCEGCGYPCRLKHRIYMPNNGPLIVGLDDFPLFYHPSAMEKVG